MFKQALGKILGKTALGIYSLMVRNHSEPIDLDLAQDLLGRLPRPFDRLLRCWVTYRYRMAVTGACGLHHQLSNLKYSIHRTIVAPKKILFYPDQPKPFHAIYKVLCYLGYTITSRPEDDYRLAAVWWLAFDGNPFFPLEGLPRIVRQRAVRIVNERCRDISKNTVNALFEEAFGYPLAVDPRRHRGKCVRKANWNALHIGTVIDCPIDAEDERFVYQKLIHNEVDGGLVEDMRVPIFSGRTPFVYLKYRPVDTRFIDRRHTNKKAGIAEVDAVLSTDELAAIHRFCHRLGMDAGEVDVLRDRNDGRIYIVDANNTPSGPTSSIGPEDGRSAVMRLSRAFETAFER